MVGLCGPGTGISFFNISFSCSERGIGRSFIGCAPARASVCIGPFIPAKSQPLAWTIAIQ